MTDDHRVLLIDPGSGEDSMLAKRLRMQGLRVEEHTEAEDGVRAALADPPTVLVANLWMPYISGVQLCRLLRSEESTKDLPIILRGPEGQRNRFWAERAGACDYVLPGRIGDLVRAIQRIVTTQGPARAQGEWWDVIADVRDRIAGYLDEALFDAVVAGEIRALGTTGDFDRLFDLLSQFVSRVTSYRWLALTTSGRTHLGVHYNPAAAPTIRAEVLSALDLPRSTPMLTIEDQDAYADEVGPPPIIHDIVLGGQHIGRLALAAREPPHAKDAQTAAVIARELAGPIRIALLMEDARRLASVDPLTGIANRRAFLERARSAMEALARTHRRLSLALLDVDHFKLINDRFGHGMGDAVLAEVGAALSTVAGPSDTVGRWGGEEFVMLFDAAETSPAQMGESIRARLEAVQIRDPEGTLVPLTASVGVAELRSNERVEAWIDRVDQLMYRAKAGGRNRVEVAERCLSLAAAPAA